MDVIQTVVIVDDHKIFRMGLGMMLNNIPFAKLIGEAKSSAELFSLLKKHVPDVIFMDIHLDNEYGVDITQKVLEKYPEIKILAMTSSDEVKHFSEMLESGAYGFMLKNVREEELAKALNELSEGNRYFSKEFQALASSLKFTNKVKKPTYNLTSREEEVLKMVCHGYSNQEIADKLFLSYHTIDSHRRSILNKTGAKNTAEMIRIAVQQGFLDKD